MTHNANAIGIIMKSYHKSLHLRLLSYKTLNFPNDPSHQQVIITLSNHYPQSDMKNDVRDDDVRETPYAGVGDFFS